MAAGALETIADYIDDMRVLLQDTIEPYRYDNDSLITAFNLALMEAARVRPDLFVDDDTNEFTIQSFSEYSGDPVHMEYPFRAAFVYGACAHALARDSEDVQDARAITFGQAFHDILQGRGSFGVRGGNLGKAEGQGQ